MSAKQRALGYGADTCNGRELDEELDGTLPSAAEFSRHYCYSLAERRSARTSTALPVLSTGDSAAAFTTRCYSAIRKQQGRRSRTSDAATGVEILHRAGVRGELNRAASATVIRPQIARALGVGRTTLDEHLGDLPPLDGIDRGKIDELAA